jgi:hypothetical protein
MCFLLGTNWAVHPCVPHDSHSKQRLFPESVWVCLFWTGNTICCLWATGHNSIICINLRLLGQMTVLLNDVPANLKHEFSEEIDMQIFRAFVRTSCFNDNTTCFGWCKITLQCTFLTKFRQALNQYWMKLWSLVAYLSERAFSQWTWCDQVKQI